VVRHRKRVARDIIERPEGGVIGVGGVGLPAASLPVLIGSVSGACAEVAMSDNVE